MFIQSGRYIHHSSIRFWNLSVMGLAIVLSGCGGGREREQDGGIDASADTSAKEGDGASDADADMDADADTDADADGDADADADADADSDFDGSGDYQWHTFFGSVDDERTDDIALDSAGNVYLSGLSNVSWKGPAGEQPLHAHSGGNDLLVLKLRSNGAYQWHTFYGAVNSYHFGYDIALDSSGNVYITGYSGATWNGPGGEAPLHAHGGGDDLFVLKLSSNGAYQWHTFFGIQDAGPYLGDYGNGIALDSSGHVYITGVSHATWDGPGGEAPLHGYSGHEDILVLMLDSSGAYQWHTFFGAGEVDGSVGDCGNSITLDSSGNAYITGHSTAVWDGPNNEIPLHDHSGGEDLFVLKLDPTGAYQWHTFLGSYGYGVTGYDIALDSAGNVYLTGSCSGSWTGPNGELPLQNFHGQFPYEELFVLKLSPAGAYQWHTFYGSTGEDEFGYDIAVDAIGNIYVTGRSDGIWGGPDGEPPIHAYSGGLYNGDIFVLALNSAGKYQWHTYFGSSDDEEGDGIALDPSGDLAIVGNGFATWSGPNGEAPIHAYSGKQDLFVLKLNH